jgi:hypothetical protein
MRRSLLALCLVGSIVPIASLASAQDAADAGAPIATTSATTTTAPTPTPTQTQAPTPTLTLTPSDQEPLRLGRLIELEADRARAKRYGGSAVEMIVGAGGVIAGALVFTTNTSGFDGSLLAVLGVAAIVGGGLQIVDGIISLVVESPMERLFNRYAPVAIDKTLSVTDRMRRGELMLEAMANAERTQRITGGASGIVLGVLLGGLAVFVGADNDIWNGVTNATTDRPLFTTVFALAATASIGEGIGKVMWERGAAEVAWEHWHAMHESVVVQTSKVHFTPMVGPTRGGAVAGFSLRF